MNVFVETRPPIECFPMLFCPSCLVYVQVVLLTSTRNIYPQWIVLKRSHMFCLFWTAPRVYRPRMLIRWGPLTFAMHTKWPWFNGSVCMMCVMFTSRSRKTHHHTSTHLSIHPNGVRWHLRVSTSSHTHTSCTHISSLSPSSMMMFLLCVCFDLFLQDQRVVSLCSVQSI